MSANIYTLGENRLSGHISRERSPQADDNDTNGWAWLHSCWRQNQVVIHLCRFSEVNHNLKGGELWGETWREGCKHTVCSPFKEAFGAIMYSLSLQWMKIIQVWYMQTPSSSILLVISFSSIKLTILVTHDGVYYHHNEGKDGRGEERNERGRGAKSAQLSQRLRLLQDPQ